MEPSESKFDELKQRTTGLEGTIKAHIEAAEQEARDRVASIVADAERDAEGIRADAERQASEIRADTKRVVAEARERVNELMRLRQALFATLRETLGDFESAVARTEEERAFTDVTVAPQPEEAEEQPAAEEAPDGAAPEPQPQPQQAAEPSGVPEGAPVPPEPERPPPPERTPVPPRPGPSPATEEARLQQAPEAPAGIGPMVEVEVKPLKRFEAAKAVEHALGNLPLVSGVYMRSFEDGVAVLDTFGVSVNTLLNAMRASFPIPFILRNAETGRLVLQVDELALLGDS